MLLLKEFIIKATKYFWLTIFGMTQSRCNYTADTKEGIKLDQKSCELTREKQWQNSRCWMQQLA